MNLMKAALLATALSLPLAPGAILAATPADTLVVAENIDDIVSIDPAEAYEFSSSEYVTQTYDRLVQYDAPDVTKLVGGLASEWQADDANKTITFTLRDGVKFTSGNPLRPEDVVYSFKRVLTLNKSPAFILAQLGWTADNIDQMVTADGNKVVLKYDGDFSSAFVLNVLAARPASVVDAVTVQSHEADGDMGNAWLKQNSAGTGPFKLRTFRPAEIIALEPGPITEQLRARLINRNVIVPTSLRHLSAGLETAGIPHSVSDSVPENAVVVVGRGGPDWPAGPRHAAGRDEGRRHRVRSRDGE